MQHFTAFQKFDRNGYLTHSIMSSTSNDHVSFIYRLSLSIECKRVPELSRDDLDWAFKLTKNNIQDL